MTDVGATVGGGGAVGLVCPACGYQVFEDERYCQSCCRPLVLDPHLTEPATPTRPEPERHYVEIDLGPVGAASDVGLRRSRNEDAVSAVVRGEQRGVAVCDGVGSTKRAHLAADAGAEATRLVLMSAFDQALDLDAARMTEVLQEAFANAQTQVAALASRDSSLDNFEPSTTMVAAISRPGLLAVANIGDSRAYWLPRSPERATVLTVDDTLAEQLIREGVPAGVAHADPNATRITGWLGADAEWTTPAVTVFEVTEPGHLLVCTDGLWNYFPEAAELAELVRAAPNDSSIDIARHLVAQAVEAGGRDNVTVAVVRVNEAGHPDTEGRTTAIGRTGP